MGAALAPLVSLDEVSCTEWDYSHLGSVFSFYLRIWGIKFRYSDLYNIQLYLGAILLARHLCSKNFLTKELPSLQSTFVFFIWGKVRQFFFHFLPLIFNGHPCRLLAGVVTTPKWSPQCCLAWEHCLAKDIEVTFSLERFLFGFHVVFLILCTV